MKRFITTNKSLGKVVQLLIAFTGALGSIEIDEEICHMNKKK